MPAIHHGTPGQSLTDTGEAKYRASARIGAHFERRVANAIDHWLRHRPEPIHVFHDLSKLEADNPRLGRRVALGATNIDHVILLGRRWIMLDAKGTGQGQLRVENGRGVLITPTGERRPQPWMDTTIAHSQAGVLYDLTGGKGGAAVWVLPENVDYSHPSVPTARCLARKKINKIVLSISELTDGDLETDPALLPPYEKASPQDVLTLTKYISTPASPSPGSS